MSLLKKSSLVETKFVAKGNLFYINFLLLLLFLGKLEAQQFINGRLIRHNRIQNINQEWSVKGFKEIRFCDESAFGKYIRISALDTLKHDFCPVLWILPNRSKFHGPMTIDSSSAIEIGFNGHDKSDIGISLQLNQPLLRDSIYELNFLITSGMIPQFFYDRAREFYEDFKIYITQSTKANYQGDTLAIVKRSDVFEIDSVTVFPEKDNLYNLDEYYFRVRKLIKGINNGSYLTFKAKLVITDSVSKVFRNNIKPNSQVCSDAQWLNYGVYATYFNLKCPFKISRAGYLCSSNKPLTLSSTSIHHLDKFYWSTGDTTSFININKSGVYWLEKNRNGCVFRDTIVIDSSPGIFTSNFQLVKCADSMLNLGNVDVNRINILWSQNDTNQTIKVSYPGIYIRQSIMYGCKYFDTFEISEYPRHKPIDKFRYSICQGDSILLKCNVSEAKWFRKNQLIGTNMNLYFLGKENDTLILKSRVKCWQVDTVMIHVKECPPNIEDLIFVPNAFSPNNDGKNDVFKIQGLNITDVKMEIYNRWGEKIFSESGDHLGWDGKFQNQYVPEGVYVVIIEVSYIDSNGIVRIKYKNQSIQLLR